MNTKKNNMEVASIKSGNGVMAQFMQTNGTHSSLGYNYHSNWGALMPVVAKAKQEGCMTIKLQRALLEVDFDAVYEAVLEAIQPEQNSQTSGSPELG